MANFLGNLSLQKTDPTCLDGKYWQETQMGRKSFIYRLVKLLLLLCQPQDTEWYGENLPSFPHALLECVNCTGWRQGRREGSSYPLKTHLSNEALPSSRRGAPLKVLQGYHGAGRWQLPLELFEACFGATNLPWGVLGFRPAASHPTQQLQIISTTAEFLVSQIVQKCSPNFGHNQTEFFPL